MSTWVSACTWTLAAANNQPSSSSPHSFQSSMLFAICPQPCLRPSGRPTRSSSCVRSCACVPSPHSCCWLLLLASTRTPNRSTRHTPHSFWSTPTPASSVRTLHSSCASDRPKATTTPHHIAPRAALPSVAQTAYHPIFPRHAHCIRSTVSHNLPPQPTCPHQQPEALIDAQSPRITYPRTCMRAAAAKRASMCSICRVCGVPAPPVSVHTRTHREQGAPRCSNVLADTKTDPSCWIASMQHKHTQVLSAAHSAYLPPAHPACESEGPHAETGRTETNPGTITPTGKAHALHSTRCEEHKPSRGAHGRAFLPAPRGRQRSLLCSPPLPENGSANRRHWSKGTGSSLEQDPTAYKRIGPGIGEARGAWQCDGYAQAQGEVTNARWQRAPAAQLVSAGLHRSNPDQTPHAHSGTPVTPGQTRCGWSSRPVKPAVAGQTRVDHHMPVSELGSNQLWLVKPGQTRRGARALRRGAPTAMSEGAQQASKRHRGFRV